MQTFAFQAKDNRTGQMVKSTVQAESSSAAAKLLLAQNLFVIEINEEQSKKLKGSSFFNKVSAKDRVLFTRQLSTLISAGLPLAKALATARRQVTNKQLQVIIQDISASVEGGSSLSAAFGKHPSVFNQVYVSLVAAGEASGTLDQTLQRIAAQQEKDAAIASKLRGAMVYPAIVLGVVVLVVVFMLVTVLPQVGKLYADLHRTLPIYTRLLLGLSSFITHFWYLTIIVFIGAGFGLRAYLKTTKGRYQMDSLKLRLPVVGVLFEKVYMARFARTLGTLLSSGVPVLDGLEVTRRATNNLLLYDAVGRVIEKVRGGKAMSAGLHDEPVFHELVASMVEIGEQAGAIDSMLDKVANYFEDEVDQQVKNLSATIEPVLMVVLGVIVMFIIGSVLFPIYNLAGQGIT
jgi:type IV pilus assembly protein PilC